MNSDLLSNAKNKTATKMLFVFGILIFTYTVLRAYFISITWDESQSYHEYIKNNIVLLQTYDMLSANNHILNTLGGIIFTNLFGVSEFTLRIPSLIAHLFFLFYSAKLVSTFGNKWLSLSAFLILNLNPYLLDYFSLARGYGLSLGLMMPSVYYLYLLQVDNYKTKYAIASILFAELATLGNLTLLNYCIVLFGVILILLPYNNFKTSNNFSSSIRNTLKQMLLPAFLFAIFMWFILPISFGLKDANALFFGGEQGFWKDTIGTIIPRLWYGLDFTYWLQRSTKGFFLLILLTSTLFVGIKHAKNKKTKGNLFLGSLLLLLFLIVLSTVVQHYVLGTLYLIERGVLFLFVLLMLIFVFFINELVVERKKFQSVIHVVAIIVFVHFMFSLNLKYVYEWKDDCETKEMLTDLEKLKLQPTEKFNLCIGVPLALESSINYYRIVNELSWLNQVMWSKKINYLNDYFFLRPNDLATANKDSLEILKTYPVTKNVLVKPKYPFNKTSVILDSTILLNTNETFFNLEASVEYSPGYTHIFNDSLSGKNSVLSCKIDFQAPKKFTGNMYLITSYQNKEGVYLWVNTRINDFFFDINKPSTAYFTSIIPEHVKAGDELSIYIWNPNKQEMQLKKMQLKCINYSFLKKN